MAIFSFNMIWIMEVMHLIMHNTGGESENSSTGAVPILTLLTPPCLEWKTQLGDRRWQDQFTENVLSSATKNRIGFDAGGCCVGAETWQPQDGGGGGEKVGQWQATQLPSAQGSQVGITLLIACVSHDHFRILSVMPRNAMGKVNKKELLKTVFEDQISKWIFNVVQ